VSVVRRFQFSLERVLKWKSHLEHLAEQRQKQARLAWEAAYANVAGIQGKLVDAANKLASRKGQFAPGSAWAADAFYANQLGQALEMAEGQARLAARKLQDTTAQRSKISAEVEALKALRSRQLHEHVRRANRREQERMDEVGLQRWQAGQSTDSAGASSRWQEDVP
jgi:flagellar export protein FliJ